jgi:hypothetical protein
LSEERVPGAGPSPQPAGPLSDCEKIMYRGASTYPCWGCFPEDKSLQTPGWLTRLAQQRGGVAKLVGLLGGKKKLPTPDPFYGRSFYVPFYGPLGSPEKMAVMTKRARRREQLFHPLDARYDSPGVSTLASLVGPEADDTAEGESDVVAEAEPAKHYRGPRRVCETRRGRVCR